MKPRRTRIKVVEKNDGFGTYKVYIPQHQGLLGGWYDFGDFDARNMFSHTNPYTYRHSGTSLASAKEQIDNYIKAFEKEEIRRKGKDIVSVEYVKYP